jgi:hypothetical protein
MNELERQFQEQGKQLLAYTESEKDIEFRQMVNQAKLGQVLQTLSPISAYLDLVSILAGTDLGNYLRLRTQARQLNRELARWQEEKMQKLPLMPRAFQVSLSLSDLPQLTYQQESLSQSFYRAIPSALALVILHLLAFVLAASAFNRYDAR